MGDRIAFADTTLRDGQLSLWASSMTTQMMLPVVEYIDRAGFLGVEITGTSFFKKCVRELRDDPWERLRLVKQRVKRTPLRAIRSRYIPSFQITSSAIGDLWVERLAANGVTQLRIMDQSNNVSEWARMVKHARGLGMDPILQVTFTLSPRHTDTYYAERTRAAAELDVTEICLKDPGGLLTPDRVRTLIPVILANAGGKPVSLHTHCSTGLGPLCCLEAVKLGIRRLDTAIPPLADGSSNPSIFNVAANLRVLGYEPAVDLAVLRPVVDHFRAIARRNGLPEGKPAEYDEFHYLHQVPGGMISNLRHQLTQLGMVERLEEVLHEVVRVRAEFGYPIMVTPYSQFVGVQATLNVIMGERYKEVPDEVIHYALGHWGEEEASLMDPDIRDRILSRPRARELSRWEPPQESIGELRRRLGAEGLSDEEFLLWYFAGADDVKALREWQRSGRGQDTPPIGSTPLAHLVVELSKRPRWSHVFVQKGDVVFQVARADAGVQRTTQ